MHWWLPACRPDRLALAALLCVGLTSCEGAAQQQSREILARHKPELRQCYQQKRELLTLATGQPPADAEELKRRTRKLQSLQQASAGADCVAAFHRRVDQERAAAGIDPTVFEQVVEQTLPRWEKEWNVAGP